MILLDIEDLSLDKEKKAFIKEATELMKIFGSIREVFKQCPQVKKKLWGGEFWSDGYYASTVGKYRNENMISNYVKEQNQSYTQLHANHQLAMF